MSTYRAVYQPTPGLCACGGDLESVVAEVDSKPVCADCLEETEWHDLAALLDAFDTIDTYLACSGEQNRGWILHDAERLLREIGRHRVPDGTGEPMPDDILAAEILRRAPEVGLPAKTAVALVARLAPGLTREQMLAIARDGKERTVARHVKSEAEHEEASAYLILFERVPGAEALTLREVVQELRLNADDFLRTITAAAAKHALSISDLPADVVDQVIAECQQRHAKDN